MWTILPKQHLVLSVLVSGWFTITEEIQPLNQSLACINLGTTFLNLKVSECDLFHGHEGLSIPLTEIRQLNIWKLHQQTCSPHNWPVLDNSTCVHNCTFIPWGGGGGGGGAKVESGVFHIILTNLNLSNHVTVSSTVNTSLSLNSYFTTWKCYSRRNKFTVFCLIFLPHQSLADLLLQWPL